VYRCIALAALIASPAAADPLRDAVAADLPSLVAIYKDLHANPELSLNEKRSAAIMAAEARKAGFTVTEGVGGHGVVAVMKNGPGKTLLIRADMDGLPVSEKTGLPYASKVVVTLPDGSKTGVMHACGHDTHMTGWIGAARRIAALRDRWSGTVVMIGQPAEERVLGAQAMLKDGLYTRFPKPDYAIAFHDSAGRAGSVGWTDGYALANVDGVDIRVRGVGSHGAQPHLGKDPVVLAGRIVTALQTLVAREVDPLEAGVVTVGVIQGGTKRNIISEEVLLQLTVRSYKPEVRKKLLDGIARIAKGEAIAAGMPEDRMPIVSGDGESADATFNTPALTPRLGKLFAARFGPERAKPVPPSMAAEDFGQFSAGFPGVESTMFWVGGTPADKWDAAKGDAAKLPGLHSPYWAPDAETVIATATEALTAAALELLVK
jgi:amidohydrolase